MTKLTKVEAERVSSLVSFYTKDESASKASLYDTGLEIDRKVANDEISFEVSTAAYRAISGYVTDTNRAYGSFVSTVESFEIKERLDNRRTVFLLDETEDKGDVFSLGYSVRSVGFYAELLRVSRFNLVGRADSYGIDASTILGK